jgi:hypothetical protein
MTDRAAAPSTIDVRRPSAPARLAALRRAAAESGLPVPVLLAQWLRLRLRRGLALDEYLGLRLYDRARYGNARRGAFVGIRAARRILLRANYRFDLYGLIDNKIACDFLLAAHGLPVMPTVALYHRAGGRPSPFLLRSAGELRAFLADPANYPLFGKPLAGRQSLGSVSLERYESARDACVLRGGRELPLEALLAEIAAHYATGYLFQRRVSPHAALRPLCGDRLATVRVLTVLAADGPRVWRAAWKIPAGGNVADNFWRVGNLLAELDLASGRVLGAVRSTRHGFEPATHHPDSGHALAGAVVPHWPEILDLAHDGARVMADLPLLGWDIAPVDAGALIVEVNQVPDFRLHQIADRRGMLDAGLARFLAERKAHAAAWRRQQRGR